jgi:UDP-2-acetamido-2,6-beta-L-arabino-hexul-4-ose reductase
MIIGITGAKGFVGKNLTNRLQSLKIRYVEFNKKKINLLKPNSLKEFVWGKQVIVHLAAYQRFKTDLEILRFNILSTKNLLDAINRYNPNCKFIFASSFQIFNTGVFSASKKLSEEIIENNHLINPKARMFVLRFSNLYGHGAKPFYNNVIATFIHQIKKNEDLKVQGDGEQKRDFLHVDDAVEAIIKVLDYNDGKFEIFNICSGRLTSINELVDSLRQVSKKNIKVRYEKTNRELDTVKVVNSLKAKKVLKWKPTIKLQTGLKLLLENE